MAKTPKLGILRYDRGEPVWCEACGPDGIIPLGNPVAWWPILRSNGRIYKTAYCKRHHHEKLHRGSGLK